MSKNSRYTDNDILQLILEYCNDIFEATKEFNPTENPTVLDTNRIYLHAVSHCFEQIGEKAKKLSDEFCAAHSDIPWKSYYGFRNISVHNYEGVDTEIIWDAIQEDISDLKNFCENILDGLGNADSRVDNFDPKVDD